MDKINKITEGVIWKEIIFFAIPILFSSFFQHFYIIVDTIIIGKYLGALALSSVGGSVSKITTLLINFFIGLSIGITAYCSQAFGKGDYKYLKNIIFNGIIICFILAVFLAIIGIIFSNNILLSMNTPKETLLLANIYLRTYLSGIVFLIIYNALTGIIRALGDSRSPLYVLIICSILNILLDLLFIIVFNFNVFGIALATILSQFVC